MNDQNSNRLGLQKSLYLSQHAAGPIHWWAFGPEAMAHARDLKRPIFLSIGYSSCHWCHVMNHESFENENVAKYLNDNFVCIKVDREEHPDLDSYYQAAAQALGRNGGWPLSAFLLPNLRPFFIGTYFPPAPNGQIPGFMQVLEEIKRAFEQDLSELENTAGQIEQAIATGPFPPEKVEFPGHFPHPMAVMEAIKSLQDNENGGYGRAPKFPQFSFYEWAVEQMLEGMITPEFGEHIVFSLEKMLMAGVMDHARGGIHRYATDDTWNKPHFEKMLYDQAGLLRLLAKFSLLYPSPLIFDHMINTLDYLDREMLSEKGYFFAAQDADSEGSEGLFFTYTLEEFEDAIAQSSDDDLIDNLEQIKKWFGITPQGNFEMNLNTLSLCYAERENIFTKDSWERVRKVKTAIAEDRKLRVPPATDTKGVASWNFLMLSALADVIQYCRIDVIKKRALTLFETVLQGIYPAFMLSKEEGKAMLIRHSTTQDKSLPYFEDYVFFAHAMLRTYELSGNRVFKENFKESLDFILEEFQKDGVFYTHALNATDPTDSPNKPHNVMDSGFMSPLSTFLGLLRRAAMLFMGDKYQAIFDQLKERYVHDTLKNPLATGEGLRAFTYPDSAYRRVSVPAHWPKNPNFIAFLNYFLPRFVLSYHGDAAIGDGETSDDTSGHFEICNSKACEFQGDGMENFIQSLTPSEPSEK